MRFLVRLLQLDHRRVTTADARRIPKTSPLRPSSSAATRIGLRSSSSSKYATPQLRTKFGERAFSHPDKSQSTTVVRQTTLYFTYYPEGTVDG